MPGLRQRLGLGWRAGYGEDGLGDWQACRLRVVVGAFGASVICTGKVVGGEVVVAVGGHLRGTEESRRHDPLTCGNATEVSRNMTTRVVTE